MTDDFFTANTGEADSALSNTMGYFRLESDSEIEKYEFILSGWKKKPGAKGIWEKDKKNSKNRFEMTQEAVNFIISSRRFMTKSVIQANLSGSNKWKLYDDTIESLMDSFDAMLMIKGEDYNLSTTEATTISAEMEEFLRLVLTRTLDNKERDRDQLKESFDHEIKTDGNTKGDFL